MGASRDEHDLMMLQRELGTDDSAYGYGAVNHKPHALALRLCVSASK